MDWREKDRIDPDWRKKELDELAKPLVMGRELENEMVLASCEMECEEILDTHSDEYNDGFLDGFLRAAHLNRALDEVGDSSLNTLHNIYDTWLKDNDSATPKESVT